MAGWKTQTVNEVVTKIRGKKFVLPVIQRRLKWDEDNMTKLFDTLLKEYSFGAVIVLKEEAGHSPLFESREFSDDGDPRSADLSSREKILDDEQFFVIDGQQRLQSFYIGLCGSYKGKRMYFDLYSDFQRCEYDFRFAYRVRGKSFVRNVERGERPLAESEIATVADCLWYPVNELYEKLSQVGGNIRKVIDEIIKTFEIEDENRKEHIRENVARFNRNIFDLENIGISEVNIDNTTDRIENRQRLVELFRRLNSGGTQLTALDLVASRLKGFDSRMEDFLDRLVTENSDIRITQDELIKLIMTLQDKPLSEVTDLDDGGEKFSAFALDNADRIRTTLAAMRDFLRRTKDYTWFALNRNRSPIPLYLLAYHFFYAERPDENFFDMKRWLRLSLLNGIFRRGCGWTPSERGIRELHEVFKNSRGEKFPTDELFDVCKNNLHAFYSEVNAGNLDEFGRERDYMFFLIYGGTGIGRVNHIQPRSRLLEIINRGRNNITEEMIDSVANLELLSREDDLDKGERRLREWIDRQEDRHGYLNMHLIPADENLWKPSNFKKFLQARAQLIADKINASMR